jgi:DNA mismatch repair protein MutL
MGFRGEALPSIASVSRVRLATAVRSAETGIEFRVEGGRIGTIAEAPPVAGTSIEVADLFFNQPARKKFLKSIPTELSHISRVIQQAALAWPSVHFRLVHNGMEMVNYPAVQAEQDRIGQVYRRLFLDQCRAIRAELAVARIGGYAIDPVHARSTRTPQELFLNRRPVRNAAVLHAVAEGYGASLAKGCHPIFVLFLDVDPDRVDVNVHPTKREIRFSEPDMIHQLVRRAVRQAMETSKPFAGPSGLSATSEGPVRGSLWSPASGGPLHQTRSGGTCSDDVSSLVRSGAGTDVFSRAEAQLAFVSETAEPYGTVPAGEVAALGQLNRTFLVVRIGGDLAVIDQHTAHERVLFERLYRAWIAQGIRAQPLLLPETVELSAPHAALLLRHQGDLEKLGLELEPFGSSAVLVRSVPTGLGKIKPDAFLEDLLDDLNQWDRASTVEMKVRPVLASLACHGAVRAGRSMELPEIEALVEDWRSEGEMTTCPHGRRTVFRLSTDDLEKMFGRAGW